MTDTITVPRALLEQALEALEKAHHAMQSDMSQDQVGEAVAALRSALEQPQQVIDHYEAALKAAFPEGAQGPAFEHWNEARRLQQEIKP